MKPPHWALAVALAGLFSPCAHAQAVVSTTTTTQVDAVVEAHVETTTVTTTAAEAPAVVVAQAEVAVAAQPAPSGSSLTGFLLPRFEILALDPTYEMAAWGGSVLLGLDVGEGWSGGALAGYAGGMDFDRGGSEVDLALEVMRDFHAAQRAGFVMSARAGVAFPLASASGNTDPVQVIGQLGLGARISLDPRIAVFVEVRAQARIRPTAERDSVLSAGLVSMMALRVGLD